ncbi:MAG: hypothetical protein ACE5FT_01330 [Candidatus Nanoarchaeia archaeon]
MGKKEFDFIVRPFSVKNKKSSRKKAPKRAKTAKRAKKVKRAPKARAPKHAKKPALKWAKNTKLPKRIKKKIKVSKTPLKHPIERRFDMYSEDIYEPFGCRHSHHMNCIRCGLMQFAIGMVTGLAMALLIAKVAFV